MYGFVISEAVKVSQRGKYLGLLNTDLTMIQQLLIQEVGGREIVPNDTLANALVGRRSLW